MRPAPAGHAEQAPEAPTLVRRLASGVYEGVVLFGVLMVTALIYGTATDQRHALHGQWGLRAAVFVVLAIYFVWFWTHGGQTVAMKTWHVRLVAANGAPVEAAQAFARYLLAWLWFIPALAALAVSGTRDGATVSTAVLAGIAAYAGLAKVLPGGQFLHDVLCGTRLIDTRTS